MPDFVDNTAGYSIITGTADYLMTTTSTGKHLRLDQALTNGQQVAYYAIGTSNGADAFESGIGTWQSSGTKLVRGTVTNSTNGGTISWDAGTKTVYIVANAATMVNTADERLDSTGLDELDPGTTPDGTEIAHFLQDGDGVSLTTQQILGDPVRAERTHGLNYLRGYTGFHRTTAAYLGTNGAQWGGEPWVARFSGTSASVNTAKLLGVRGVLMSTGSDTNGYAAIEHMQAPNLFNFGYSMETTFKGGFNTALLPTVEACTAQLGFVNTMTALATAGFYFEATEASPNWFAVVRASGANVTRKDTGVAYTTDYTKRFKVVFDASDLEELKFLFYINEVLVATTLNSERIPPALTSLYMAAQIRKTAGTTAAGMAFTDHSYAIETAELVGF